MTAILSLFPVIYELNLAIREETITSGYFPKHQNKFELLRFTRRQHLLRGILLTRFEVLLANLLPA
mgnify:CR=1 FL=1